LDHKTIETEIIWFNEAYYKKVFETKVFTDKIHNKLQEDNTRDKILSGKISKDN